jgi:hypothetical protein
VTAATGANTIANGNNGAQVWNWAQTTNSQTAFTFGETSAATGTTDTEVAISTAANSTATPLAITQGAISNTTATPAFTITSTYNDASLSPIGAKFAFTETTDGTPTYFEILGGPSATTTEYAFLNNQFELNGIITESSGSNNMQICGGNNSAGNCTVSSNALVGGLSAQGAGDSATTSGGQAGYGIFRGGMLTGATPNAAELEGPTQLGAGYLKGTAIANVGDVVCGTTTAYTVTDCAITPATNVIGIATSTTNPIGIVTDGQALVKLDGALTAIGDNVCIGTTTAGLAHDNGSTTTACTLGTAIGVIIADSGTLTGMSGNTTAAVAMSTTLVLVQLHIK